MSDKPFHFQKPFPLGPDQTEYELISTDGISVAKLGEREILTVAPEALTLLANEAIKAISFKLRPSHLKQVAAILDDPESTENDRMVALTLLRNGIEPRVHFFLNSQLLRFESASSRTLPLLPRMKDG